MEDPAPVPAAIREYADQAVEYVRRALNMTLEFDSDTLPVLDHYLRSVAGSAPETLQLVIATSGAYFGEVVRRRLGGRWEMQFGEGGEDAGWRFVLPTGLNFSPEGFVAAAIAQGEVEEYDAALDAPARMRPYVEQTLQRMGELPEDEYYSLCNRFDTVEHIHETLVAVAAKMMGDTVDPDAPDEGGDDDAEAAPEPVADEPSGGVN
ncbi:MAG: hypothetical protein QM831_42280 [Kofleriaceae bacterium]